MTKKRLPLVMSTVFLGVAVLSINPSQANFLSDAWNKAKDTAKHAAQGFLDANTREAKKLLEEHGITIGGTKGEPKKPLSERIRDKLDKGTTKFYDYLGQNLTKAGQSLGESLAKQGVEETFR